jgi:hypothetical protein
LDELREVVNDVSGAVEDGTSDNLFGVGVKDDRTVPFLTDVNPDPFHFSTPP